MKVHKNTENLCMQLLNTADPRRACWRGYALFGKYFCIRSILQEEQDRIKNELAGKCVSVIFDGTTRCGEAMAIVL